MTTRFFMSPDSRRAISRTTVVLPTPGAPSNSTELLPAGNAHMRRACVCICGGIEWQRCRPDAAISPPPPPRAIWLSVWGPPSPFAYTDGDCAMSVA
eukprot:254792-Chlamydomonas_euryale.AAC.2